MVNLLYITFGQNISVHSQAYFSIYTFLNQKNNINSINIITDNPAFYYQLKHHVRLIPITGKELQEWKGAHDFFWRIKIKAIATVCAKYPGEPVVYLDTDTFLFKDLSLMHEALSNNKALMHEEEGPLMGARSKTEKRMWSQIRNKTFAGIKMNSAKTMWNAGVVGTPNTAGGEDCELALQLCDQMCEAGVTRRLIEQFSISIALSQVYGIAAAEPFVAHYWSNKDDWDRIITRFFTEAFARGHSTEETIKSIGSFDFAKLPVKKRTKNTSVRLHKLVDKIFKVREEKFVDR